MSYKTRLLTLVKEVRGEPVAHLLALSDVEEIDAYVDSLRKTASLLGQPFPDLPDAEKTDDGSQKPGQAAPTEQAPEQSKAPAQPAGNREAPAAPAAAPQAASEAKKSDEEERRARLLARIAKVLKVAAPTFRTAPVQELEAFAASLEKSYRQLSGKQTAGASQARPEGGARYRVLERGRSDAPQRRDS